jgi:NAD(P) transhydrogenase
LAFGGKIDYFVDTVFNYPTLAECYKSAAFDGLNRMGWPGSHAAADVTPPVES